MTGSSDPKESEVHHSLLLPPQTHVLHLIMAHLLIHQTDFRDLLVVIVYIMH